MKPNDKGEDDALAAQTGLPSLPLYPDRLKFAMSRAKISTAQLARMINASAAVISNMRGRMNPSYNGPYLNPVAAALDVPVEWLAWNTSKQRLPASKNDSTDGDVVGELATVVARLIAKKVMSRSEVIATISLLRIRESEA
jgi:hypothetical protein